MAKIDLTKIRTYSLKTRKSKVSERELGKPFRGGLFADFLDSMPNINAVKDIKSLARAVADSYGRKCPVIVGMGAHVIKCGLSPLVIQMINDGIISCVAMNGACMVHDFELAFVGMTSEIVDEALNDGCFGMAEETGSFINCAVNSGVGEGLGLGKSLGKAIWEKKLIFGNKSIFRAAYEKDITASVHAAVGTDIVHIHPQCDGASIGLGSHRDFLAFSSVVADMDGGVYINLGSAVILPEVFLKAVTLSRNLGHKIEDIVTANLDFIQHYRPTTNVVRRPNSLGGRGYSITGHHEILFPLLCAMIYREIDG